MEKHWIQTYTGRRVCPLHMEPDDVCIEDIAHALSLINRFTGHTQKPYSVSQHSVMVGALCSPDFRLDGLLHDATEAYITDISRPLKLGIMQECGPFLREIEDKIQKVICEKFELTFPEPAEVKTFDNYALGWEAWSFFGHTTNYKHWQHAVKKPEKMFGEKIRPVGWKKAERLFLKAFYTLLDRKNND